MIHSHYLPKFSNTGNVIMLRELCGHDELIVESENTIEAVGLLSNLIVENPGESKTCRPEQLATADLDRLFAVIYEQTFGPRIDSTLTCQFCNSLYDIDFLLDDLMQQASHNAVEKAESNYEGNGYHSIDGYSFRLPTGEDELAITHLSFEEAKQTLLQRCLSGAYPEAIVGKLEETMQHIAPILQMLIKSVCPECGKEQSLYFDIRSFLMAKIKIEKKQLLREVHQLALAYRWSHNDILSLPRKLRKAYYALNQIE